MKYFFINGKLKRKENYNFKCRNTKLEGAISGPDRTTILQCQISAISGRSFHYWSGARQITLSGPHFSRSTLQQNFCTGCSSLNLIRAIVKFRKDCIFTFSSWMRRYWFYVKDDFRKFHHIFTF